MEENGTKLYVCVHISKKIHKNLRNMGEDSRYNGTYLAGSSEVVRVWVKVWVIGLTQILSHTVPGQKMQKNTVFHTKYGVLCVWNIMLTQFLVESECTAFAD